MFDKRHFIKESLKESAEVKNKILSSCEADIIKIADIFVGAFSNGNKIMFCGNGGSAADSQHLATELIIRLSHKIKRPALPAVALTTDSSTLTAGGNDIGFENVLARVVEGLGKDGDILVVISTSGNSENLCRAVEKAHLLNVNTVGFLGGNGGKLRNLTKHNIIIPSSNIQRIQEGHITIGHIICEIVENELYNHL